MRVFDWLARSLYRALQRHLENGEPRSAGATNGTEVAPRVFFGWRWNSPHHLPGRPPYMVLEIDDLRIGRKVRWVLSPAQAGLLCETGLDAIGQQVDQFGDPVPRDYDVRQLGVRFQ